MQTMTSKRARLETIFSGQRPDRPAVALWRHWPVDDQRGDSLARATLDFQERYDFDFIKVTPSSNFCVAGYGAQSDWEGNLEGTRNWGPRVIRKPEDWRKLKPLDPAQGLLSQILEANRLIGQSVGDRVPFIQTIFNPLSQAKNLAGELLLPHLRRYPDAVKEGLAAINESILRFVAALKPTGAAGLFLAVQHAQYGLLSEAEYQEFCRPFDLQILDAAGDMWFHLLHLHGEEIMFDALADYPVQVLNWHDQETEPNLAAARARTNRALCGGLRQWQTMVRGTADDVRTEARAAIQATGGERFILGTGCVTPIVAPTGNIRAARQAVDSQ
jgi:uroporphyrinogen decarboxylase